MIPEVIPYDIQEHSVAQVQERGEKRSLSSLRKVNSGEVSEGFLRE